MLARLLPRFSPFDKLDWPTLLSLSHHCRVLTIPKGRSLASKGRGRFYLLHGVVGLSGGKKVHLANARQRRKLGDERRDKPEAKSSLLGTIAHGTEQARYPLDTCVNSRLATRKVCQLLWIDTEPVAFLLDSVEENIIYPLLACDSPGIESGNEISNGLGSEKEWMIRFLGGQLLRSVKPSGLQALINAMSVRQVVAGERVIAQGDLGTTFYVISHGYAEVSREGPVASLGPGDFFGEDALISGMRRNADVHMSSNGELRCMSAGTFHTLLAGKIIENSALGAGVCRLDVSLAGRCKDHDVHNDIVHIPVCHLRDSLHLLCNKNVYVLTGDTMPECRLATFILLHHGFNARCCLPCERHQAGTVRSFAQALKL